MQRFSKNWKKKKQREKNMVGSREQRETVAGIFHTYKIPGSSQLSEER